MLVKLQSALDEAVEIERLLLRRGRAGKLEKILNNARGAASLAMREFKLAAHGFVLDLLVAQDFGNAKNGSQGIVQLVSDSGEHLAHGGELFGLNELLFTAFDFRNIAARNHDAFDFPLLIEKRAEMATD